MTDVIETPPAAPEPVAEPKPEQLKVSEPKAALAVRPTMEIAERGVMLRSFEDLQRFSKMALESGAAPKGMSTIGQVAVAIQTGLEAGLTPMHALQAIVVINGATSWRGQSAVGRIRSDPRCKYIKHWTEGKGAEMKGVCISRRVGADREERTEFTVEDARTARLWGKDGPWSTYPGRQLMWRAVGFHAKDQWSDVLGGFPIEEEVRDYSDIPDTPEPRPSLPPPSTPDPLLARAAVVDIKADAEPSASSETEPPAIATPGPPAEPPVTAPCCGGIHGPGTPCPKQPPVIEESFLTPPPEERPRKSRLRE